MTDNHINKNESFFLPVEQGAPGVPNSDSKMNEVNADQFGSEPQQYVDSEVAQVMPDHMISEPMQNIAPESVELAKPNFVVEQPVNDNSPMQPPVMQRAVYPQPTELPAVVGSDSNLNTQFSSSQPAKPKSRWGVRSLVAFVAGGLIATGAFSAAYFLTNNDKEEVSTVERATPSSDIDVGPGEVTPLVQVDGEEAAISVAEALGPAVVQIETASNGEPLGAGSGVVYKDNFILTNNHVIEDADVVRVRQSSGRVLEGEIVGADSRIDIAVIEVKDGGLPIAQLSDGKNIRVGQTAIAIGSPFLLQQTVTAGIVSALNRPVPSVDRKTFIPMIQTDAPINQGNSGGALADIQGRVIGINTSIQTDGISSNNAGVGFAIPIDIALKVAERLEAGEEIESGFLGVFGEAPSDGAAGVEMTEVTNDSAADLAGVEIGDIVLTMDDAPVTSIAELAGLVTARTPGEEIVLGVKRDGESLNIKVILGRRE